MRRSARKRSASEPTFDHTDRTSQSLCSPSLVTSNMQVGVQINLHEAKTDGLVAAGRPIPMPLACNLDGLSKVPQAQSQSNTEPSYGADTATSDRLMIGRVFPFHKLPLELRLATYKYALSQPDGLYWVWKSFKKNGKLGTFVGIDGNELNEINRLPLVCRAMHTETSGLMLQTTELHFDPEDSPFSFKRKFNSLDFSIRSLRCFMATCPLSIHEAKLNISLYDPGNCRQGYVPDPSLIRQVAKDFPHMRLRVVVNRWFFGTYCQQWKHEEVDEEDAGESDEEEKDLRHSSDTFFMSYGRMLESQRAQILIHQMLDQEPNRTWRFYPFDWCNYNHPKARCFSRLAEKDRLLAIEWSADGI